MIDYTIQEEQAVIGAILQKPEILSDINQLIEVDDFSTDNHKMIFNQMLELYSDGKPISPLTIAKNNGKIDLRPYLASLYGNAHAPSSADYHAKRVAKLSRLRTIKQAALEIADLAGGDVEDPNELVDVLEKIMFSALKNNSNLEHIKDIAWDEYYYLEKLSENGFEAAGVQTGFVDVDNILTGFKDGELILIAARPAVGKTAFAIDIALNSNVPTGLFSLEMSKSQVGQRVLAKIGNVSTYAMRTGKLKDDDWKGITNALAKAGITPVYVDDTANLNIVELRGKARRMMLQKEVKLIIIDYLQLMNSHKKTESRNVEVAQISRGLKLLAREMNIPVIALSQLSRGVEQREGKIPRLADLRDSGALEQDADVVIFLHRPNDGAETDLIIAKNRQGPTGSAKLTYQKHITKFVNYIDDDVPF